MNTTKISIIAAIGAQNRVIGKDNDLPWRIKADMEHFKKLTLGYPVIMGRNTWESIPKRFRPLPNRSNVIVTRNMEYTAEGATTTHSLEKAIEEASKSAPSQIFIIGGASVYGQALPLADTLYLTLVEGDFDGDTFFPEYTHLFKEISRENHNEDGISFLFCEYERA